MTIITITDIKADGREAVTKTIEDRQEGETVSLYVGRVRKGIELAVYEIAQADSFCKDNYSRHMMTVACPELDAIGKALGTTRESTSPRSFDPTTAKRIVAQGLNDGGTWLCGQLEKFLNGELEA